MSTENHPNLYCVGLSIDLFEALRKRIRGEAANVGFVKILPLLESRMMKFVYEMEDEIDEIIREEKWKLYAVESKLDKGE